jgi:hypothetical protein
LWLKAACTTPIPSFALMLIRSTFTVLAFRCLSESGKRLDDAVREPCFIPFQILQWHPPLCCVTVSATLLEVHHVWLQCVIPVNWMMQETVISSWYSSDTLFFWPYGSWFWQVSFVIGCARFRLLLLPLYNNGFIAA